jgi:hypothetical protein
MIEEARCASTMPLADRMRHTRFAVVRKESRRRGRMRHAASLSSERTGWIDP